jgi:hypothetical protein
LQLPNNEESLVGIIKMLYLKALNFMIESVDFIASLERKIVLANARMTKLMKESKTRKNLLVFGKT